MGKELKSGCSLKRLSVRNDSHLGMNLPVFANCPIPIQFMLKDNPPSNKTSSTITIQLTNVGSEKCYLCCNSTLYNCTIV